MRHTVAYLGIIFPSILAIVYILGALADAQKRGAMHDAFATTILWGPMLQVIAFGVGYLGAVAIHLLLREVGQRT